MKSYSTNIPIRKGLRVRFHHLLFVRHRPSGKLLRVPVFCVIHNQIEEVA